MRGLGPDDERLFDRAALGRLRCAAEELTFLRDRGYPLPSALAYVGDHHQLAERQRIALRRSVCSHAERRARASRLLPLHAMRDAEVNIDGFNLLVTLEVALSGGIVLVCADGTVRDLAGLRGSYRIVPETERAIALVESVFAEHEPAGVRFLLDAPVSNSGRLRAMLERRGHRAELAPDVDVALRGLPHVVSADAAVLDLCASWHNLARAIVDPLPDVRRVELG